MKKHQFFILATFLFAALAMAAEKIEFRFDRPGHVYAQGEKIEVEVMISDEKSGTPLHEGVYDFTVAGKSRKFNLNNENPFRHCFTDESAAGLKTVLIRKFDQNENQLKLAARKKYWLSPDKLKIGMEAPDDFMEFWKKEIAEAERQELNVKKEELTAFSKPGKYKVYKVSFNAPKGRIYGFLNVPEKSGPLPAEMTVCHAGPGWSKPLYFSEKRIILAMNIHNFDPDERDNAYAALNAPFKDQYKTSATYMYQGLPEPGDMYYVHGVIGCYRALEWLAAQPEVNARRIGYFGTSQGGSFGLFLGGLSDKFAAIVCDVPALCDNSAYLAGRSTGFPWYPGRAGKTPEVQKAVGYFDAANFARYVKAPIRIICSEFDEVCYPFNVRVAFNRIPDGTDKEFFTQFDGDHGKNKKIYGEQLQWMRSVIDE